jgi:hypothetical protein
VISLIRQCHGGRDYSSEFHRRQRGSGPLAELLAKRFALAVRRLGLNREDRKLDTSRFRVPRHDAEQLELL